MAKSKEEKIKENEEAFAKMAEAKDSELEVKSNEEEVGSFLDEEGQLTVDVYEDGDEIVVESTVAGVDPNDLEINITSESVTIKGKRERQRRIEEKNYFYQECFWGTFSRSVILPEEVDPDKSEAKLADNRILTIRMPKLKRKKPKKMQVKTSQD
jgi:HSP20 family protein